MKKWKKGFLTLTAAIALSLGCGSLAYAAEISVNGMGVVLADPDTAQIMLTVETTGKTSAAAQKGSNQIISAVKTELQKLGVAEEDIITAYTSVYPMYTYDEKTDKRIVDGYRSNTDLQVSTNDIDNTGKYIDAALKAGATGTNGVSFSVEDQSAYYTQALQLAVKNAEKSAAAIAEAFGKPLGNVTNITENSRNVYYRETANLAKSMMTMEEAEADTAGGTSISYGKIEITANLSLCYDF